MKSDVIVVGAGPGGSSAAYHLAKRGRRVLLLDRQEFPRDKSCGDGLTRASCRILAEMGVMDQFAESHRVTGVRVLMRGKKPRDFLYPETLSTPNHGLVVPRRTLDDALRRNAIEAGATFQGETLVTGLVRKNGSVVGVTAERKGEIHRWRAPVVIAADGAASRLARQAGLAPTEPGGLGFAVRGYYSGLRDLTTLLEIHAPIMDSTDRYLLPSYGWVFPLARNRANIGVGLFERAHGANVRNLLSRFVSELQQNDPRFTDARLEGKWIGAPLRFDFSPDRCVAPGLVLVGDAAGMVSPFTGEGISYALESGKLAAEAIDRNLHRGAENGPDISDYAILLEHRFTGYFEAGQKSIRRYLLAWRLLGSTFDNERPLFTLCRKAILFPEAIGESPEGSVVDDVSHLIAPGLPVREGLLGVDELLLHTVRKNWPFLGRVTARARARPGIPLRPALLGLLAGHVGNAKERRLLTMGAAIELGCLAAIAHVSVHEGVQPAQPEALDEAPYDWGNAIALMVGDFLLSQTYRLSSQLGPEASRMLADTMNDACRVRMHELGGAGNTLATPELYLKSLSHKVGPLFELPCRLGGVLAGAEANHVEALARYGRHFGMALQLGEEALSVGAEPTVFHELLRPLQSEGPLTLPIVFALESGNVELHQRISGALGPLQRDRVAALVRPSGGVSKTQTLAREHAAEAQRALGSLVEGPAGQSLARLAQYAVDRGTAADEVTPT